MVDVTISNHGSIFLFQPNTQIAVDWIRENVQTEETQFMGHALVVEPRYAEDLAFGMQSEGLEVE